MYLIQMDLGQNDYNQIRLWETWGRKLAGRRNTKCNAQKVDCDRLFSEMVIIITPLLCEFVLLSPKKEHMNLNGHLDLFLLTGCEGREVTQLPKPNSEPLVNYTFHFLGELS